jgi:hypothetical protein
MTAPTRTTGYVDPYALGSSQYATLYIDMLEHVPDLIFPQSVQVLARMRRDPQLTAILQGWTLQLRRAQWQIDPSGCRDDVVQAVADGLGLGIAGDDEPGPARLRGVSWNDHLAAALRMLAFGFAGFEMEADTSGDIAQLSGLWERPQWTIAHIHTDGKSGLLTGVSQTGMWKEGAPEIPSDRLVWYVNDREGANWAGTSLLRPAYASWLIKEEMRRVHGISNRRWGAGVPVMEAAPGTNPTPAQMTEAMQMAAAIQAGMQSGAASPPGFTLKIQGLSGSVPDTLAYMKWLDQQMSRAALMGVLDLGDTANGSRALGDTFMDSFMLALEACAEAVADVATRQVAARIVDWNWGEDEPVPRVMSSGVGSRREVTAESLNLLLGAGALAADPALEAWVRREYRLPERDPEAPFEVKAPKGQMMTVPGTGGDGAATGPAQPLPVSPPPPPAKVAAARPRPRSRRPAGQPALFGDDDEPGPAVQAAAADPYADLMQQQWEQARTDLLADWPDTAQPMVDDLATQAQDASESGDLAALGVLAVSAGVIAALAVPLAASGTKLARLAAAGVVAEAADAKVTVTAPADAGAERVRQTADAIAHLIAQGYAAGAARLSLQLAGVDPAEVRDTIARHLSELGSAGSGFVADHVGALLSAAQHAGRLAVLAKHPARAYEAVEVNDHNECPACREGSGKIFETLHAALKDYPSAGYVSCAGKWRCRGFLRPLW